MVAVARDAGLSDLVEAGAPQVLARGLQFTEGPLWLPDGALLFQDIKAEVTYRLDPDGSLFPLREATRAANGQTFDMDGRIVFCEQNGRRLSCMNPDGGGVEPLFEAFEGKHLNSPNDIVCRSDGRLYFTDPAYGVPRPEAKELPYQGVFMVDLDGTLKLLADDFEKPNGLAFAPDERTLYVNDTGRYHTRAFDVRPGDGTLIAGSGRVAARMDPEQAGGPDGLKVDHEGRLYAAVAEGIWVFQPGGKLLGILPVPKRPSNLAWCGDDARTLAITAVDAVYQVRMKVPGVMPPYLARRATP